MFVAMDGNGPADSAMFKDLAVTSRQQLASMLGKP
jgi:hypothetical protein